MKITTYSTTNLEPTEVGFGLIGSNVLSINTVDVASRSQLMRDCIAAAAAAISVDSRLGVEARRLPIVPSTRLAQFAAWLRLAARYLPTLHAGADSIVFKVTDNHDLVVR